MKRANQFLVQPGWKLLMLDIGLEPASILTLAGLPKDLFAREEATINTDEYFALWQALMTHYHDEKGEHAQDIALVVAESLSTEMFDPAVFACLCSANLNMALQRLSQYKALIAPLVLTVNQQTEFTEINVQHYQSDIALPVGLVNTELVFFTQIARIATRQAITPMAVQMPQLPKHSKAFADYFGVPVTQADIVAIRFSAEDANKHFLTENNQMWDYFEPVLKQRLSEVTQSASSADRIKATLSELLPSGVSSIDNVADKMATSTRSLQRQLQQEGTSYQMVLQEAREQLARHYLQSSSISQGEISFLLGFQETNSFVRAFRNWTGHSPGQYRKSIIQ